MKAEISQYWQMLLGREPLPISNGVMSLMESATSMYVRASEMAAMIQQAEQEGVLLRGSSFYRFRTGELRTFMEACAKAIELGSRRVTAEKLAVEMKEFD
jgi:hypothetical protein